MMLLAAAAVVQGGPGITAIGPVRRMFAPRLSGYGDPAHVALTIDDGPDPAWTPRFMQALAARGVRATFFLLGSMLAKAPGLGADLIAAGHQVGVHGWDHYYLPLRTPRAVRDDLARAKDLVSDITGTVPTLFRPPYGVLSGSVWPALRELDLSPVLWTCYGREWARGASPESVYQTVRKDLGGGGTILLHDSDCTAPAGSAAAAFGAVPLVLDECEIRGLAVGPLAEHGWPREPGDSW